MVCKEQKESCSITLIFCQRQPLYLHRNYCKYNDANPTDFYTDQIEFDSGTNANGRTGDTIQDAVFLYPNVLPMERKKHFYW
jgi:hypothetical protein